MKLIIPDNNDPNLLDTVKRLKEKKAVHQIAEIYGKLTENTYLGSGRTNLWDYVRQEAMQRILAFKKLGIEYEWSINDIVPRFDFLKDRAEIIKELEWIDKSGIKKITVASYGLAKLAEKYCASCEVTVSFFANVDSMKKLKQWANLKNVTTIVSGGSTYRNIPLLENMIEEAEKFDAEIRVIANLGCMADCIQSRGHAIIKSYASIDASSLHCRPFTFYCIKHLIENPEEFLQLPIIRPENLDAYESIGVGSVKLVDRARTTSWIEKVVGHYLNGSYDGNILDLTSNFSSFYLNPMSNQDVSKIDINEVTCSRAGIREYRRILPELMGVSILPSYDFLSCNTNCDSCEGCPDTSAVTFDPGRRKMVLKQLKELEERYLFK